VFGNDVLQVYRTLKTAMEHVRSGNGPALVEAYTCRWNSHVGPEDDSSNNYRTQAELEFWKANSPILLLEEALFEHKRLTAAAKDQMESEIADEIAEYFAFAKNSAFPARPDWQTANADVGTPLADRLLGSTAETEFDHFQPDARLEPY
jgi:pyruvate dehydrogenase E1 component alpha subunit